MSVSFVSAGNTLRTSKKLLIVLKTLKMLPMLFTRTRLATVLGIAPVTGHDNYHVTPLVLSASCKCEKGEQLAHWMEKFIQTYREYPDGEKCHGPICTVCTDGESSFCKLCFILGLEETIDKSFPLGKKLSELTGLNLQTGCYGILGTCDSKHIIKCFATMLRSPKGIQVGDTHVTSGDILHALKNLAGMTLEKAASLLNPIDKKMCQRL